TALAMAPPVKAMAAVIGAVVKKARRALSVFVACDMKRPSCCKLGPRQCFHHWRGLLSTDGVGGEWVRVRAKALRLRAISCTANCFQESARGGCRQRRLTIWRATISLAVEESGRRRLRIAATSGEFELHKIEVETRQHHHVATVRWSPLAISLKHH